ncbi:MAG: hypothetical protein QM539_04415 [Alphaproteobacteria bacterium]|nr:hypothetical protein [Alphaproteobacteria bacterium]
MAKVLEIQLGFFEFLERRIDDWYSYSKALQLILITNDIEIYSKHKYKKSIYKTSITPKILNEIHSIILQKKVTLEDKKQVYIELIDNYCKPQPAFNLKHEDHEDEDRQWEHISNKYAQRLSDDSALNQLELETYQTKQEALVNLYHKTQLTALERAALAYFESNFLDKAGILKYFSKKGVLMLANKAAIKLIYYQKISNR